MRATLVGVLLAFATVVGCTSSAPPTASSSAPFTTPSSPPDHGGRSTISTPPGATGRPSSSSATSAPPRTARQLCAAATTDHAVATCIIGSLNAYWSKSLHKHVDGHVMLGFPAKLPSRCDLSKRDLALLSRDAFECPANRTLYFGPRLLRRLHRDDAASGFSEQLAETLGHEEGHLVQDTVHQQPPKHLSLDAGSRFIEQQADCLSGVWANGVGLNHAAFLTAARKVLTEVEKVEPAAHRRTHGTVSQRVAAIRRGLTGVAACHLPAH